MTTNRHVALHQDPAVQAARDEALEGFRTLLQTRHPHLAPFFTPTQPEKLPDTVPWLYNLDSSNSPTTDEMRDTQYEIFEAFGFAPEVAVESDF